VNARTQTKLQHAVDEMRKFQRQMNITLEPLNADIKFALTKIEADRNNEQFWRRTLIRCLLANIEALLWNLKQGIKIVPSVTNVRLTPADNEIVDEQRTTIVNGKQETRKNHLKFRDNIKATFSLFGKVHGIKFKANCNQDFVALCDTYELRSRLMHPKKPMDPEVSDSAILASQQGVKWLKQEYDRLMDLCEPAIVQFIEHQ